ncbi:hypothetical protein SO802_012357 [Lithocarpus litseifolius]|uniref:F-box domain-containing protein n=1 Tax=Lithocarpus litseifolius TaxID=425828 RepID=A0AAW2D390_9ROSI
MRASNGRQATTIWTGSARCVALALTPLSHRDETPTKTIFVVVANAFFRFVKSGIDIIIICMHASKRKQTRNSPSTSDIISNLPSNIIENILPLRVRDAVKTSVLSTEWRCNWVTLPQLVFDESFCPNYPANQARRTELFKTIYHSGPILKFTSLSIPGLQSCPEINHLISFLARSNMDFTLKG